MQAPIQDTLTNGHCGTIFFSLELSLKSWAVTLHSPDRDRITHRNVKAGMPAELLALIDKVRSRAAAKLGSTPKVVSCYEAGYDGFWLHRLLTAAGIENYVFDPASIAVDQRSRRTKTDRIDGEVLLRTLMAHCRREPRVVKVVHVPTPEQEDARRRSRERDRLVKEQTAHINRIKGLLRTVGWEAINPRRRNWLAWLEAQRDWAGQPLPPHIRGEIEREHARLMLVGQQLKELAEPCTAPDAPAAAACPTMQKEAQLQNLKSLGPAFASTLAGEVFYKDFDNRRQVAAYFGLAPSHWRSGGIDREQGISKAGNRRARQKAVELTWLWLRHQPGSALSRWFQARTLNASKRIRRITIVAMARKLMVALWRYLTTGLVPEGAVLKA
jgi:transposase